jgi:hypothetical protein
LSNGLSMKSEAPAFIASTAALQRERAGRHVLRLVADLPQEADEDRPHGDVVVGHEDRPSIATHAADCRTMEDR